MQNTEVNWKGRSWTEQQAELDKLASEFPHRFQMYGQGESIFRIYRRKSYVNDDGRIQLVVQVHEKGEWLDWSRGTPAEIRRRVRPANGTVYTDEREG